MHTSSEAVKIRPKTLLGPNRTGEVAPKALRKVRGMQLARRSAAGSAENRNLNSAGPTMYKFHEVLSDDFVSRRLLHGVPSVKGQCSAFVCSHWRSGRLCVGERRARSPASRPHLFALTRPHYPSTSSALKATRSCLQRLRQAERLRVFSSCPLITSKHARSSLQMLAIARAMAVLCA